MSAWLLVPLAFAAMFCQDVFGVWLVRAENQGRAHAAGVWDMLQGLFSRAGQYAGVGTLLLSHDWALAGAVQVATSAADYWGSRTGVILGKRLDERRKSAVQQELTVSFDGGNEQQFAAWLRKQVRINGGGPSWPR